MEYLSKDETVCLVVNRIAVTATKTKLTAYTIKEVGDFELQEIKQKAFDHIEDLLALPVRGLTKLAYEFVDEIKG